MLARPSPGNPLTYAATHALSMCFIPLALLIAACSGISSFPTPGTPSPSPSPSLTPGATELPYPYERTLYIRGTINGWTSDESELAPYRMAPISETILYGEAIVPFGNQRFKIADSGWSAGTNFGNPPGTDDVIVLGQPKVMGDNGFDLLLDVQTSGIYNFTVDHTEPLSPSVVVEFVEEVEDICAPNLSASRARWMVEDALMWRTADAESTFLYYAEGGGITLEDGVLSGGTEIALSEVGAVEEGDEYETRWPYLKGQTVYAPEGDLDVASLLRGQLIVASRNGEGEVCDATGVQTYGIIDEQLTYDGDDLGLSFGEDVISFKLWAPTAQAVAVEIFDDPTGEAATTLTASPNVPFDGVWTATAPLANVGRYYLWEVSVYVPSASSVQTHTVTDPYSVSLSANSARSQIIDLSDPATKPEGWDVLSKPPLDAPEDIVLYELHVRDFSASDLTVDAAKVGTFAAFTEAGSAGMVHLASLAEAGLTHVHLLPSFDIATVEEIAANRTEADIPTAGPASEDQQAAVNAARGTDAFNWGYDPWHYGVPEGSYATDPDGAARVVEFREMVMALNGTGLRVVMDQVYNHTNAAGLDAKSVLDKIVPGYYYRLDENGNIQGSSCCPDTATEHAMMEKLMVDMVKRWAVAYKVDGFRFDLMGHHTVENMANLRAAVDALTLEADGVDGEAIYLYGEGWKFGSLDAILPDTAASQPNTYGLGIGTFNDRIRDSVRGGSPFASLGEQGFSTGLFTDDNRLDQGAADDETFLEGQKVTLLNLADNIRIGLAGNLRDMSFTGADGELVSGSEIIYRGAPGAGYTADPQEIINYVSVHDNQTLWDNIQAKAPFEVEGRTPATATMQTRVRMHNLSLSLIALGQGIPFFHAGSDLLRSKSGDKDSYDSGDHFNRLDFSGATNNWGVGLPIADKNEADWPFWAPRLEASVLSASSGDIAAASGHFKTLLNIRKSTPLFRLRTAEQIMAGMSFLNAESGEDQIPGLIVMHLDAAEAAAAGGDGAASLAEPWGEVVVLFNAAPDPVTFNHASLAGAWSLHPAQASAADTVVSQASCGGEEAAITAPGRSALVCVR